MSTSDELVFHRPWSIPLAVSMPKPKLSAPAKVSPADCGLNFSHIILYQPHCQSEYVCLLLLLLRCNPQWKVTGAFQIREQKRSKKFIPKKHFTLNSHHHPQPPPTTTTNIQSCVLTQFPNICTASNLIDASENTILHDSTQLNSSPTTKSTKGSWIHESKRVLAVFIIKVYHS